MVCKFCLVAAWPIHGENYGIVIWRLFSDVEVQVGRTTDANVTLTAGSVSATVQVTAEGIQTTSSTFDAVQNSTAIQKLPLNGRRFQDLVGGTPTVQVDPSRGQISLSGQRGITRTLTSTAWIITSLSLAASGAVSGQTPRLLSLLSRSGNFRSSPQVMQPSTVVAAVGSLTL